MIRIGTRGSALALWQARAVAQAIDAAGGPPSEIVVVRTTGDEAAGPPDAASSAVPSAVEPASAGELAPAAATNIKRTFVKEIEDALLAGRIDVAVHSSKDLPAALPGGLVIAGTLARDDPRDVLLLPEGLPARDLHPVRRALGASPRIGTSSVRRMAELGVMFPGAHFLAIRGNVDTRLRKLDAGECDVLVLAAAGIKRLGFDARISAYLSSDICVPAPGQGIVAIEIADNDSRAREVVNRISDPDAFTVLTAERAVVEALGGGCQMPLGAHATLDGQDLTIVGLVASLDGRTVIRAMAHGNRGNPASVGEKLAALLIEKGAGELLARVRPPEA